ncbi:MAG: hypothetical protein QOJ19_1660 [Acidimicrobiia bacterium]|nr:hypothetical protein [Acidimicrobiia bacterium]
MGGVEMLPLGILIFAVGALVVLNLWALVDAKLAVSSASREAIRTMSESSAVESGMVSGDAAARRVISEGGRNLERFAMSWTTADGSADARELSRCLRLVARASYRVPAVAVPWVGALGSVEVTAASSELVDPYRDGLPGVACAA